MLLFMKVALGSSLPLPLPLLLLLLLLLLPLLLLPLLLLLLPPPPPPYILHIVLYQRPSTGGLIAKIYAAGGDNSVAAIGGGVCRTTVAMQV